MLKKVGLECWSKGKSWLRKSSVFWQCVPKHLAEQEKEHVCACRCVHTHGCVGVRERYCVCVSEGCVVVLTMINQYDSTGTLKISHCVSVTIRWLIKFHFRLRCPTPRRSNSTLRTSIPRSHCQTFWRMCDRVCRGTCIQYVHTVGLFLVQVFLFYGCRSVWYCCKTHAVLVHLCHSLHFVSITP